MLNENYGGMIYGRICIKTTKRIIWIISRDYHDIYSIKECHVHKKQIRARYTFSVRGRHYYCGIFTKNSIGKTVFFSKETAIESLKGKEYKLEEWT